MRVDSAPEPGRVNQGKWALNSDFSLAFVLASSAG